MPFFPAMALPLTIQEMVLFTAELQVAGVSVIVPPTLVSVITGGVSAVSGSAEAGVKATRVEMAMSDAALNPTMNFRIKYPLASFSDEDVTWPP